MTRIGDAARWLLIGGDAYPANVEGIMSGATQARYAHASIGGEDTLVHPDYMFASIAHTVDAIHGAFTLRLIGLEGMPFDELAEHHVSTEKVPQLEFLNNDPVMYKLLGVVAGMNSLRISKLVHVKDGMIAPRGQGIEMLEAYADQAYTVLPEELRRLSGQDIGGEYSYRPMGKSSTEVAAMVLTQYSPYYNYPGIEG